MPYEEHPANGVSDLSTALTGNSSKSGKYAFKYKRGENRANMNCPQTGLQDERLRSARREVRALSLSWRENKG